MPDAERFRDVMGHFATGVTVVTSLTSEGRPCGLTANAVTSVSLDPLLLLVCLESRSFTHDAVIESGNFAVNILDRAGRALAERFSRGARERRFEGLVHRPEATGAPVLSDSLAWLDCTVQRVYDAGDHSVVLGHVVACSARAGEPLIFYRGRYAVALDEAGPS